LKEERERERGSGLWEPWFLNWEPSPSTLVVEDARAAERGGRERERERGSREGVGREG
jgi:hypothetical protein